MCSTASLLLTCTVILCLYISLPPEVLVCFVLSIPVITSVITTLSSPSYGFKLENCILLFSSLGLYCIYEHICFHVYVLFKCTSPICLYVNCLLEYFRK